MSGRSSIERQTGLQDMTYAGDGVYLGHDGYQVWAVAFNGMEVTSWVALPPDGTWQNLKQYADKHYGEGS